MGEDFTIELVSPPVDDVAGQAAGLARMQAGAVRADAAYISHSEYFEGLSPDGRRWADDLEARYREALTAYLAGEAPDHLLLLVRDGDESVIGFAGVLQACNGTEIYWVIEDMAVLPAARRRGIGSALIDRIAAMARQAGAAKLVLESGANNHGAHALFEREGFEVLSKVFIRNL